MHSPGLAKTVTTNSVSIHSQRRSGWPAVMDLAQSLSGLLLVFVWFHMLDNGSILISKDAMCVVSCLLKAATSLAPAKYHSLIAGETRASERGVVAIFVTAVRGSSNFLSSGRPISPQ